jgi:hypothetical protein
MVVLVGKREILETMVANDTHATRHTGLRRLLSNE